MSKIIVIGFMLFAIFFGAGNLIFPLKLGFESGSVFNIAMLGFVITGVGLPLLGLIASAVSNGGIPKELEVRVHPIFSLILMSAIYLTIGPLFAIPRTALVSYEIGFVPFFGNSHNNMIIFSVIFFIITLFCCINTTKMVDIIGKYLTPCLLISILALCGLAFFKLDTSITEITIDISKSSAFSIGFLEGYLTMDAMASIVFGILVLAAVKASKLHTKSLLSSCITASLIAAAGLISVYYALGWVGNHFPISSELLNENQSHLGAYILVESAKYLFGSVGPILVSIMVILACLTTAIGLVAAVSDYFYEKFPRFGYKTYAYFFTALSFILSNMGLSQVITYSIPVLLILYPITIVVIAMILLDKVAPIANLSFTAVIAITLLISILSQFFPESFISLLPLHHDSLGWLTPAIAVLVLGYMISPQIKSKSTSIEE